MAKIDLMGVNQILHEPTMVEDSGKLAFDSNWQELKMENLSFSYQGRKVDGQSLVQREPSVLTI